MQKHIMVCWSLSLTFMALVTLIASDQTVTVTQDSCDVRYDLDALGTVTLEYTGADLGPESVCTLSFFTDDLHNNLCVSPLEFVNECSVGVEYHGGFFHELKPDEVFCHTQPKPWCSEFTRIFIAFQKESPTSIEGMVNIRLQIQTQNTKTPDYNPNKISLSMLTGTIIAAAVVLIGLIVVAAILHYRHQKAKQPKKYRTTYRTPVAAETKQDYGTASSNEHEAKEDTQPTPDEGCLKLDIGVGVETGAVNPAFDATDVEPNGTGTTA